MKINVNRNAGFSALASSTLYKAATKVSTLGREKASRGWSVLALCWLALMICLSWPLYANAANNGPSFNGKITQQESRYTIHLPAQNVADSLNALVKQTGAQFLFPYELAKSRPAKAVSGKYTIAEAVERLLEGSGLVSGFETGILVISDPGNFQGSAYQNSMGIVEMNNRKKVLANTVAFFLGASSGQGVLAEGSTDTSGWVLEEVVVSATRRETSKNDTAISIAVIGEEEMSVRDLSQMDDYLRTVPGISYVDTGVGRNTVVVRGLTVDPIHEASLSGPTVGVYFGDVSIGGLASGGGNPDLKMIDLQRVELLRGPQGTLFGAGSLGGTVRNIPNPPVLDEVQGSIKTGYSSTAGNGGDNTKIEGVFNLPLIEDELAVRAVIYRHDGDDYIKNIAGTQLENNGPVGNYSAQEAVDEYGAGELYQDDYIGATTHEGGRVSVLWNPNEKLSTSFHYIEQNSDQDGFPYVQLNTGGYTQVALQVNVPELNGEGEGLKNDLSISNLVIEYDLEWASLVSSSAWMEDESEIRYDITHYLGGSPSIQTIELSHEVFSQEFRLVSQLDGKIQYVVGAYFEEVDSLNYALTYSLGDLSKTLFGTPLISGDPLIDIYRVPQSVEQLSFYGEVSVDLSEELTLTLGGRHFDYDRELREVGMGAFGFKDQASAIGETGSIFKSNLSYRPNEDTLLYAEWAEGFRFGGANFAIPESLCDVNGDGLLDGTTAPITSSFDSDTSENFELGAKFSLLDRRLQVNAAAYTVDWQGIPLRVFPSKLPEQDEQICFASMTINVAEARSQGFEVETTYQLTPNLTLNAGGGYTEVELAEDVAVLNASSGDRLRGTPEYTGHIGLLLDMELLGRPFYFRSDYAYVSTFYEDIGEQGEKGGGYGELNMGVGMSFNQINIDLFGKNLTNEDSITSIGTSAPDTRVWRLRPRTIGLNVSYQF